MYIIADSSSTRTEWVLVDNKYIVTQAITQGLNPYFLSRREISHCIRLELPEEFFKKKCDRIYFYGAGCANHEKNKILESSLIAQFRTPVIINSDLLGAARGIFVREKGLACILGTGSNSCIYNGENVVANIKSGGYIIGDEGSACDIGKVFINDCLKGLAPEKLVYDFYSSYSLSPGSIMDAIYSGHSPNKTLAKYSLFLISHQQDEYVRNIVSQGFRRFFERTVMNYANYRDYPIGFVGRNANNFRNILISVAKEFDIEILKIIDRSIPGLIEYHSN